MNATTLRLWSSETRINPGLPRSLVGWRTNAAVGAVAWLGVAAFALWGQGAGAAIPLVLLLTLVGPLVATPLTLALAQPGGPAAVATGRWRVALWAQVPAALLVAASACVPAGPLALALAAPWILFSLYVVLLAGLRWLEHGFGPAGELALDAGLAFLGVGAVWLAISRGALALGPYAEPIPILTAAHFHVAGLVLAATTGLAARQLQDRWAAWTAWGVVFGMPLVAVGITTQSLGIPWINPAVVTMFVVAAASAALQNARLAVRADRVLPRVLWGLSACTLPVTMGLAFLYAWGRVGGPVHLGVEQMVASHAVLNVFAFALPCLAAWHAAPWPAAAPGMPILVAALGDRLELDAFAQRTIHDGPGPAPVRDAYAVDLGRDTPGEPVPGDRFSNARDAVLAYSVFPSALLEPVVARVPVQAGDLLAATHRVLPGVRVAFASRVREVFDGPQADGSWRSGFRYATCVGHPERGEETFVVEKSPDGSVRFRLDSVSQPGHPVARMLRRHVRRQQVAAARGALARVRNLATAGV